MAASCTRGSPAAMMRPPLWAGLAPQVGALLAAVLIHARTARRNNAAAALGGLAVPGGDDAAGAGDDRNQCCDVIRFQFGLDHEIEMAGGQHAVGIAVAAIPRQPHRLLDAAEGG